MQDKPKMVIYQDAVTTEIWDGVSRPRHVMVSIGWYSDDDLFFEVFLYKPAVIRSRYAEALREAMLQVQAKGLRASKLGGKFKPPKRRGK